MVVYIVEFAKIGDFVFLACTKSISNRFFFTAKKIKFQPPPLLLFLAGKMPES